METYVFYQLKDTSSSQPCTGDKPCDSDENLGIFHKLLRTISSYIFEEDEASSEKDIELHEELDLGKIFYEWLTGSTDMGTQNKERKSTSAKHSPGQSFKAHKRKDADGNVVEEEEEDNSFIGSVISTFLSILEDNGSSKR